jgi:hypothetical protein
MSLWSLEMRYGVALLGALLALLLAWRLSRLGALLWSYALVSSALFAFPSRVDVNQLATRVSHSSAQALAITVLVPALVLLAPSRVFRYWRPLFHLVLVIQLAVMLWNRHGILGASTFDAAFMAALLPILPRLLWPVAGIGIWIGCEGTALLVLVAQALAFLAFSGRKWIAGGLAGSLAIIAFAFRDRLLEAGSGRVEHWTQFLRWWWEQDLVWFGAGLGTFQWLGPAIRDFENPVWTFLHSDWLQILFELGAVGLALALAFTWSLLRRCQSPKDAALLAGVAALGLTYFPLHYLPTQIFVACVVRHLLGGSPNCTTSEPYLTWGSTWRMGFRS